MAPSKKKNYGDGVHDGLVPLAPIDVATCGTIDELLRGYARTSFGGRTVGEGAEVLEAMIRDPKCLVVMTLSGAMTVAKQGLLVCEMIDRGWVQAVISTGALMAHGFVEGSGGAHFKYDRKMSDHELYERGYDRVYDTLELEQNLDDIDVIVRNAIEKLPEDTVLHSKLIFHELGRWLDENTPEEARSILKSAYRKNVPVFVPAFTDSELGLDVALMNRVRVKEGKARRPFDPFLDLEAYASFVGVQERTGIFTIGGGVPRNWAQQLGPFLDLVEKRMGKEGRGFRFRYALRICPEPSHWGGLSGCTYSEGVSWGKFLPEHEGGRFSEILADATIVWPLLVRGMIERIGDVEIKKTLVPS
ncbi:MAG: deoxyhypusine synthase family protein [Myxococcota bacterium]|mgnify:CR=1 FL=1